MSLKKKALVGVFWSALEQFGNQAIGFVISIVLARLLLPSEFGLIAMLAVFMGIAEVLINSGLTQSLIRTTEANDEDFSTVFYFNLIVSVLIYGLIILIAPFISEFYNQPILKDIVSVYCIVFVINAFGAIQKTILTKQIDFKSQMLVSTPSLIISGVVGVTMALNGFGVWSLVWSKIAQSFSSTVQLWFWSKWRPTRQFNLEKFKSHFKFGYKLLFSTLLDAIFLHSYTIIIGKFFAPAQVGYYTKADGLQMRPVGIISGIVNRITYPLLSEIQNNNDRLKQVYKKILKLVTFMIVPTLLILAVIAEPLFRLIYTEKWLPAVPYFQILCINGILFPLHVYNIQILKVKGRSDLVLKIEIFKKTIIVMFIAAAIQFGIYGLLIASVFTSIIAYFINAHYSGRLINYNTWQQIKDILPIFVISIITGIITFTFDFLIVEANDIIRISLGLLVGAISFLTLSWTVKLDSFFELKSLLKKK